MEENWLRYAKRLQAIASTGLYFSTNAYDRERYEEIGTIANGMLAELATVSPERITGLVSEFAKGYATPKVDVRGAVFEGDEILLVREKSDGLWTMPGGFADVGLSAAENIVKEIEEEAGLTVVASSLYSVRHKAKHPYAADTRDFYKMNFICDRIGISEPAAGPEITEVGYFPLDSLPPLSSGRVIRSDIEAAFAFRTSPIGVTVFD